MMITRVKLKTGTIVRATRQFPFPSKYIRPSFCAVFVGVRHFFWTWVIFQTFRVSAHIYPNDKTWTKEHSGRETGRSTTWHAREEPIFSLFLSSHPHGKSLFRKTLKSLPWPLFWSWQRKENQEPETRGQVTSVALSVSGSSPINEEQRLDSLRFCLSLLGLIQVTVCWPGCP